MAEKYQLTTPDNTNEFQYQGETYGANSTFETSNACEAIGFYNAARTTNPNMGTTSDDPDFWQTVEQECSSNSADAPPDSGPGTPSENQPVESDTSELQGADTGPDGGVVQGHTDEEEDIIPPTEEPERPEDGEAHPDISDEGSQDTTTGGDPVDLFTGSFSMQETDLKIPNTLLPMELTRVYRSGIAAFGPFGWNWDHNFNIYLRVLNNNDIAVWRNLHEDIFVFDGNTYEPPRGRFEKLSRLPGINEQYEIEGRGGLVLHFSRPAGWLDAERIPVTSISDRYGNRIHFTYGSSDHLLQVEDDNDRYFTFEYDECGLITSIRDHTDRVYHYEHDEETKQLTCAISPPVADLPDGYIRIYHYEAPWTHQKLRHNIVRVEDGEGNVYLENTYEHDPATWHFARVTEQLYGGYLYQFCYKELQYVPSNPLFVNISSVQVKVMNPDFGLETYTFNFRGDLLDQRYRLNKDRSFRIVAWQYEYDSQGNKISATRPDGSQELWIYDDQNSDPRMRRNLLRKELTAASGFPSPSRIIWRGEYNTRYQLLKSEKNELNSETIYKYDFDLIPAHPANAGNLKEIHYPDTTMPDGTTQKSVTKMDYNSQGQLTEIILPDGTVHQMSYGVTSNEKSRLITQIFDTGGQVIKHHIHYDPYGNMTEWIDGNGHKTTHEFNVLGLIEKYHLPDVNGTKASFSFHYNSDKKIVASKKPAGSYSEVGWTDKFLQDEFDRDVLGYPVRYRLAANSSQKREMSICNDYRGLPVQVINPDGSTIHKKYDERGLLLEEVITGKDGGELIASNVYDRFGRRIKSTGFNGHTVEYEYDAFSRLHRKILANGTQIEYEWGQGDLLSSVETTGDDGSGAMRQLAYQSFDYDEKGRCIKVLEKIFTDDPANFSDRMIILYYDKLDRVVKIINPQGGETIYQYDGMNRLVGTIDPAGNEERLLYDKNNNVTRRENIDIEPDGSSTTLFVTAEYDERNRLKAIIEPDGSRYGRKMDDRDLIIEETDPLGISNSGEYDAHQALVRETLDTGGLHLSHSWDRDIMSRPVSFTDPMGQVSKYQRDDLGRILQTTYPNGFTSEKTYNDRGLVAMETLGSGTRFSYKYDSGNRLQKITNSLTPASIQSLPAHIFHYDGLDRLVSARSGLQKIERNYDSTNRLIGERTHGDYIQREYDDINGVFTQRWPDGRTEKFIEDQNGMIRKIREVNHSGMGNQSVKIAQIEPSGPDKAGETEWGSEVKTSHQYDDRKRLTTSKLTHPGGLTVTLDNRYDTANRKRLETIKGPLTKICLHEFDHKYRVTGTKSGLNLPLSSAYSQSEHNQAIQDAVNAAMAAGDEKSFTYNEGDERIKVEESVVPDKNYSYDSGHRITSDGTDSYTHHADGTLRSKGSVEYGIDALGRIVNIKSGGDTLCELEYDALGRPSVIRLKSAPERILNYFGKWNFQEKTPAGIRRQMTLHPETGIPIAWHLPRKTINPVFDGRYNLRGVIDDQGKWLESFDYSTFGIPSIFDNDGNAVAESALDIEPVFGGQRYLAHPTLYLSGKRLMDPANGLFLSADVLGYADSPSLYVYTGQNPVDYIDPDGDLAFLAGLLIAAAVGAVISGGLNAARQGIAIAEGSQEGWEWGQFGMAVGVGAVAGPLLVVAPELAIPLALYGVGQGAMGIAEGNYATGTFDIVTSIAPFGFKGVRTAVTGRGSLVGQARGLGPSYSWGSRVNRLTLIGNAAGNYIPPIRGRRIGVGFARSRGGSEGHVAVTTENTGRPPTFFERNAMRLEDRSLVSSYRTLETPPEVYDPLGWGNLREHPVFEYTEARVSPRNVNRAANYAHQRISENNLTEPFDFTCSNCSHFTADVLSQAGFRNFGTGRGSGVNNNFVNFGLARAMGWNGPVFSSAVTQPNDINTSEKK